MIQSDICNAASLELVGLQGEGTIADPNTIADAGPVSLRTTRPQRRYYLFIFLLFAILTGPIFVDTVRKDAPQALDGAVSFAGWGALDQPVQLAGEWRFEWLSASNPANRRQVPIRVPGSWSGQKAPDGSELPAGAMARYSLTLNGLQPGQYRLYINALYSANRVLIDDRLVSSNGTVGRDAASSRYHVRAHDIAFESDGRPLRLAIEISTFHDIGNGFNEPPLLGNARAMQGWIASSWAKEFFFNSALILVGLFGLVVYFTRRSDHAALFLGLTTLTFLLPMLVFGFENIWMLVFPATSFAAMLFVLWAGCWIALIFWLAYIRALFPSESPRRLYLALQSFLALGTIGQIGTLFIWGTLAGSIYNRFFFVAFLAVFVFVLYASIRAALAGRSGALLFVVGQLAYFTSLLMMLMISFGVARYDEITGIDFASFGILVYLLCHIMILAERWAVAIMSAETLNDDLGQLLAVNSAVTSEGRLESLLTRIVGVSTRILNAERSSLFIHDPAKRELWSLVAEGVVLKEIRLPDDSGIAGSVFQANRSETVADAYADARFKRDVDAMTGYRTRNLVAAPVVARDGRKLGVLQALNSMDGNGFSVSDEARLSAFAAQAAIAIDNSTLFSEVVASRNYNESILQSMSSGVATLQDEGHKARLNDAAARILKVSKDQAEGSDARAFIAESNPWLITEIDAVAKSGEPKSLLDSDLVTSTGEAISANVSIVPLRDAEGPTGVLLMLDDISSSKRMEGAMRRFMTQEVMDQVLGQQGDLLFGSACNASVLFADIRNFTTLAEKLSPRETVDMLNEIFTDLFEAVAAADGVLDKYIGDAIMAVFGAPLSSGQDAKNAVEAALKMQEMMAAINARRVLRDASELRLGIGISSGEVIAGTIGSPKRMDYTVIGDSVNLAARLQDATKSYNCSIIVCERTAALVSNVAVLRELDRIRVKGRETLETIFEVTGRA